MKIAGKIIMRFQGSYNETETYRILDVISLDNRLYVAKTDNIVGVSPTPDDSTNWLLMIDGSIDIRELEATVNQKISEITSSLAEHEKKNNDDMNTLVTNFDKVFDDISEKFATINGDLTKAKEELENEDSNLLGMIVDVNTDLRKTNDQLSDVENELTRFTNDTTQKFKNLQNQIDGAITTHFFAYEPSESNKPASGWTTNNDKNVHLGDLFYNTTTGYCYRWLLQNGVYSWARISDSDVTKALSDASSAITRAKSAEAKATAAEKKVAELEAKVNGMTFRTNIDTGNLEWDWGSK